MQKMENCITLLNCMLTESTAGSVRHKVGNKDGIV